jgi:hypothetical protein
MTKLPPGYTLRSYDMPKDDNARLPTARTAKGGGR